MAAFVEFTLSYNSLHGHLRMHFLNARLKNQHPQPFAKVHILPDRKKARHKPLEPLGEDEVVLTVYPADVSKSTLEILFYDVNRYLPPKEFMGITLQFHRHECMGTVQVPLKGCDLTKLQSFREDIIKCEARGKKAQNICQLLCFEEDFRAFCTQFYKPSAVIIDFLNDKLINPVFQYLLENIERSRGPVIYFIGRSGAGKSSLINALANIPVAEVSDLEASPAISKFYSIDFDSGSSWKICDTRALGETVMPDETIEDPVAKVKEQIAEFKPDTILYVVSAKDVRNCLNELTTLSSALYELQETLGVVPPVIAVITHSDLIGTLGEWPPEEHPSKQQQLKELLVSTASKIVQASRYSPISPAFPYYGYSLLGKMHVQYLIPVALPQEGIIWNVETLTKVIGKVLPTETRFQFYQPQKRPYLMRDYSSRYIKYFSGAAVAISAIPLPGSETLILTALQILMICVIANIAGRDLSLSTAMEFMAAMGVTYVVGQGFLRVAQDIIKFVPVAGPLISASVAGAGTYAMGKSAQAYFFDGKKLNPSEFQAPANSDMEEWGLQLTLMDEEHR